MTQKLNDQSPLLKRFLLWIILAAPFIIHSQVEIGKKAPELHLEGIYNCNDKSLQLESLKGNIVVLDFWATWCSPCVAAFPENNELYTKYKDQNVTFIAITDDSKEKLENFLKKVKIDFCVGRDDDKQEFKNYNVTGRPAMFIINRDGTLVYRGIHVSEETLLEVINTNGVAPEQKSNHPEIILNGGFRGGEDPVFNGMKQMTGRKEFCSSALIDQLIIRPSLETNSAGSAYRMKNGHVGITYCAGSLKELVVFLYDLPSDIWVENKTGDSCRYDLVYWRKKDSFEGAISEIEQSLSDGLSITFDSISSQKKVLFLSLPKTNEYVRTEEQIEEGTDKAYTSISLFLTKLEELTNQFYIADNSLKNQLVYNQGMEWKKLNDASAAEIIDFLKAKGITVNQEMKVITTYVINRK
ncbi:TlpA disulfide reductase family protein [Fluviicola taffensis]|uniref:TlpA family protein disulfide reductase n=1 Tax=Fluviicola taffensis TaxID=191579 RepID=UPI0031381FB6